MIETARSELPHWLKLAILPVVVLFTFLGLLGLLLPVIPGILFLGIAAMLMARISRRFARRLQGSVHWRRWRRWHVRSAHLSPLDRARLALLLVCRKLVAILQRGLERRQRA